MQAINAKVYMAVLLSDESFLMEVEVTGLMAFQGRIPVAGQGYGSVAVPKSRPTEYRPLLKFVEPKLIVSAGVWSEELQFEPFVVQLGQNEQFDLSKYQGLLETLFKSGFKIARSCRSTEAFGSLAEVPVEEHLKAHIRY